MQIKFEFDSKTINWKRWMSQLVGLFFLGMLAILMILLGQVPTGSLTLLTTFWLSLMMAISLFFGIGFLFCNTKEYNRILTALLIKEDKK